MLADVHAELDDASPDDVERRYIEARELASALSMRPIVAACHLGLGRFLHRAGSAGVRTKSARPPRVSSPRWG